MPQHLTVCGELGLEALATLLDAVGVEQGDRFLDIGAGDGVLVAAAALLFPNHLKLLSGWKFSPNSMKDHYSIEINYCTLQTERS